MAGQGRGLPPEVRAELDALWRRLAADMQTAAHAEIIAVVGQAVRGGKVDAAYIVPDLARVFAGTLQAGRADFTIPANTESVAVDVVFPLPFPDGSVVKCFAIEVSDNVTAVCAIYDGEETPTGCRVLVQCGEGITSIFSGAAPATDLSASFNWLAVRVS